LESIGLIHFQGLAGFQRLKLPKRLTVFYYGQPTELEMPNDADNRMEIGKVLLTKIGHELAPICGSAPVEGFREYVLDKWQARGYIKKENDEQGDSPNADTPPLS